MILCNNSQHYDFTSLSSKNANVLTSVIQYVTILLLTREDNHDCDGRIAHSRRRGPSPQIHAVLHQGDVQAWGTQGHQNRWSLESQTRRFEGLHRRAVQRRSEQINKASVCWQRTIKDLVAIRLFLTDWNPRRNSPRTRYPISFSIVAHDNNCQWLYKTVLKNMGSARKDLPMNTARWYSVNSTSNSNLATPNSLADMDFYLSFTRKHTMNANTSNTIHYEIVYHKRGMLVRIQGKFVPNRRGRPKHFPLYKHIQQYLQKVGAA